MTTSLNLKAIILVFAVGASLIITEAQEDDFHKCTGEVDAISNTSICETTVCPDIKGTPFEAMLRKPYCDKIGNCHCHTEQAPTTLANYRAPHPSKERSCHKGCPALFQEHPFVYQDKRDPANATKYCVCFTYL